ITVNQNETMIRTLEIMNHNKISGIAIVDNKGQFIGNTSGVDLKLFIKHPQSSRLYMTVLDFVNEVRRNGSYSTVSPAIAVENNSTLAYVISKLTVTGMHRVFVVDHNTKAPIAVISVEDIVN